MILIDVDYNNSPYLWTLSNDLKADIVALISVRFIRMENCLFEAVTPNGEVGLHVLATLYGLINVSLHVKGFACTGNTLL
jgi:hypothetical protein